eukprot:gnl/TRDRNA2_/TRDRNA2_169568_c0_seq1.p1 gnl/TRDRNA2_/TRDRNA2_169568_c0~~gnl/TRDRNA2_/TRDRNA2_169568_c0_seq1.p1  ORF type:complete len:635 (-),score=90.67 gnl/TRDRNA2_/TRDRNA2_169568_c0_seq1:39-1898(-)
MGRIGAFATAAAKLLPENATAHQKAEPEMVPAPRPPKPTRTVPGADATTEAKLLAVVVALHVRSPADAEALDRCIRSIAAQRSRPRSLWVSWHADDLGVQALTSRILEDAAMLCVRRGMPLTQVEQRERLAPWEHVRGVLQRRQTMGSDVCDLWVQLSYFDSVWHAERCQRLVAAATAARAETRGIWSFATYSPAFGTDGLPVNEEPVALDATEHSAVTGSTAPQDAAGMVQRLLDAGRGRRCGATAREATIDAMLVRMPVLAEFVAGAPQAVLQHELCDLAYISFIWSSESALELQDDVGAWACFRWDPTAGSIVGEAVRYAKLHYHRGASPPQEVAEAWATGVDFELLLAVCERVADASVLAGIYDSGGDSDDDRCARGWAGSPTALAGLVRNICRAFRLCGAGSMWVAEHCRMLAMRAQSVLGVPHTPTEQEIHQLLRSNKLKASTDLPEPVRPAETEKKEEARVEPEKAEEELGRAKVADSDWNASTARSLMKVPPAGHLLPDGRITIAVPLPRPPPPNRRQVTRPAPQKMRLGLGLKESSSSQPGVLVDTISTEAREHGFRSHDLILSVDEVPVKSCAEFQQVFSRRATPPFPKDAPPILFVVQRASPTPWARR